MNKEVFVKLIGNVTKYQKEEQRWSDFGIPLYESPISELSWSFFNTFIEEVFTTEAVDWINWWLFEKSGLFGRKDNQAWNEDGSIIPTDTVDDLWNIIETFQK